ncbi:alpha-amylase family glycosyl hydrolase [aff. Roholtiella sp. LEGE 12411]|uniref:alpha-amylase family glycosyl hydrolase n=1 Tax=aff. Roholtiella sp. LEGE 12411 TaxID=1828822 RepID=UPI00188098A5|nr:alpha-amylase family glycosyl hydrolase [aff. Roholtiella sp. LEGE 12411]MBE9037878.1 alpha-amylase [aff. Roholtiella sp. LEGE 12411]
MKLLPFDKLGAREANGIVDFGIFLPWISQNDGNRLWVKIIHEKDQFLQDIQPLQFELKHSIDSEYGDYWSIQININTQAKSISKSAWGEPGRYVYRYFLQNPNKGEIDWIIDPFAREFGVGKLSAFTLGYQPYEWSQPEKTWKTPNLKDIVLYELMIDEFGGNIDGTIEKLSYLADLGINCLEIMPLSNVALTVDWGFLPLGYFGIDERFGKRRDLQKLIDAAHQHNIAVIVDAVYGHTGDDFPYSYVYKKLGYRDNPFMGTFAKDYFGESTDYNRKFTQDFFYTVNYHWLDVYHVDGFRYDCVPNYWDGSTGVGYANLVFNTYKTVKEKREAGEYWQRFFNNDTINLIQCAEQLEGPKEILEQTYTNSTWQNETLGAAKSVAHGNRGDLANLGFKLGLDGYPTEITNNSDQIAKMALQYIENHDHSRFVCNFGAIARDNDLLQEGNRGLWYKVQPYLISIFTAKGIPMLWQGQEFGENYYLPEQGFGRVMLLRPVRWDYFYDAIGNSVITLVRKLIKLRKLRSQFTEGSHFFYNNHDRYHSKNVLLFSRQHANQFSLVALNFGDSDQSVPFWFPIAGDYQEELHSENNLIGVPSYSEYWLNIPKNYGRIWTVTTNT